MKKQVVNCETNEVSVIDIPEEEKTILLAASAEAEAAALLPKPKTAEERLAELEAKLAELLNE